MNQNHRTGYFCLLYILLFLGCSFTIPLVIRNTYLLSITLYVIFLLFTAVFVKVAKLNINRTFRFHKIHVGSFFLIILLSIAIRPFIGFVAQIGALFFQDVTSNTIISGSQDNLILMLIATALFPAIVEELICRGIVYSGMRYARPIKGILLTSLFFGLMHMNFQQFLYAFVLGLVLNLLVEATDSIYSSILLHFCFNAATIIVSYAMTTLPSSNISTQTAGLSISTFMSLLVAFPMALISLILSFVIIHLIAQLNGRWAYMKTWGNKETRTQLPKEKATSIGYFAAIGLCIAISILTEISRYFVR